MRALKNSNFYTFIFFFFLFEVSNTFACNKLFTLQSPKLNPITGTSMKPVLKNPLLKSEYLKYQEFYKKPQILNIVIGSIGTVFIIGGLVKSGKFSDSGITGKGPLISIGVFLHLLNFLIAKTRNQQNINNLNRAIKIQNEKKYLRMPQKISPLQHSYYRGRRNRGINFGIVLTL